MKTCPECSKQYEDAVVECPVDSVKLKRASRSRSDDQESLVGTILAERYEIISSIGKGGMGVVYKARQQLMDRLMAIKMLHSHMVSEPEAVKRFFREAQTISQVRHHHIVTLYDFGMSPTGQPYIVMDYLEGKSLKDIVKESGPLSFERADHIFQQVIEGLAAAHELNVVHRDMKPENIMLTKQNDDSDWVTLVDFGLSKLKDTGNAETSTITRIGDVCGSPPYMSPEQCLSSRIVDPRSDLYALAVVIYEALTGKLPFNVKSPMEMLDCHLYGSPTPFNQAWPELKVCTELTHVLEKALQKAPEKRQQSAQELGYELLEALRRDGPKLRAIRHRAEVIAQQSGVYKADNQNSFPGSQAMNADVLDGFKFLTQQAELEHSLRDIKTSSNKVAQDISSPVDATGQASSPQGQEGDNTSLKSCAYCGAPMQDGLKFCLSCQRLQVSPQDLSVSRSIQGKTTSSKYAPSEESRASFRDETDSDKASYVTTLPAAIKIVLALLIVWVTYVSTSNPACINTIQNLIMQTQLHGSQH